MERLFGAIPSVLSGLAVNDAASEALVVAAWNQAAGDLLSERTAAIEFFEKRLIVAVTDRTWQMHLEELAPQMLAKLNRITGQGTVRFIEFRIDPTAANQGRKAQRDASDQPPDVPATLAEAASEIADEELRASFLHAASAYLKRKD